MDWTERRSRVAIARAGRKRSAAPAGNAAPGAAAGRPRSSDHESRARMTLTELRYIVAVACAGRKRGPAAGGDRSPEHAMGDRDAMTTRFERA